jgi:hypothetical protein
MSGIGGALEFEHQPSDQQNNDIIKFGGAGGLALAANADQMNTFMIEIPILDFQRIGRMR